MWQGRRESLLEDGMQYVSFVALSFRRQVTSPADKSYHLLTQLAGKTLALSVSSNSRETLFDNSVTFQSITPHAHNLRIYETPCSLSNSPTNV